MTTQWKLITHLHVPQEVWDKADILARKWGWTVEAVLCDSLEKSFDYSAKETEEKRFKVYCVESDTESFSYTEVINTREEDRDNDFVGTFSGICSRKALLTVASEGYGINEDEIEFMNEENVRNSY